MKKVAVGESSTQALCVIYINKSWIERDGSAHGAICGRFPSLSTRDTTTPTPSNIPRRIPHAIADPKPDFGPPKYQKKGGPIAITLRGKTK